MKKELKKIKKLAEKTENDKEYYVRKTLAVAEKRIKKVNNYY